MKLQVFGERNSGTNFITQLLTKNIPSLLPTEEFGWKHGFVGSQFPNKKHRHIKKITKGAPNVFFVVIARNSEDWVRSMHMKPYHAHDLQGLPISEFIRRPFQSRKGPCFSKQIGPIFKPEEKCENVLQLRNKKYKHWLQLSKRVKNFRFVNYDLVAKNPRRFIKTISRKLKLPSKAKFQQIVKYKGHAKKKKFKKKIYAPFGPADLAFIHSELNQDQEREMGFISNSLDHTPQKSPPPS